MNRSFIVVVNPASGKSNAPDLVEKIRTYFDSLGIRFSLHYTSKQPGMGLEKLRQLRKQHTDLLAVGGDGTVNAVANAIIDDPLPVGIIPAGTGNDFIKMLSLPDGIEPQLNAAVNGSLKRIDVGKCNERYFMNGVGVGFDGRVVEYMQRRRPRSKGRAAYLSVVVRLLASYRERELRYIIDEKKGNGQVFSMVVANGSTFGGGFKMTPEAKIDDGMLDVCLIGRVHPVMRFFKLPLMKNGDHQTRLKQASFFKAGRVCIEKNDALVAHIDGELLGSPPFEIEIAREKLPVRASG